MQSKANEKKILTGETQVKRSGNGKKEWKKPTIEDVSGRVMAQPYIRFT